MKETPPVIMHIKIKNIIPHPPLAKYIERFWVFESSGQLPGDDLKLIVPNGLIKLIIPFRNGVAGRINTFKQQSAENKSILIGITDTPSFVDITENSPSGSIGVEFNPQGTYHFLQFCGRDIKNLIVPASDLFGNVVKDMEEQVAIVPTVAQKVAVMQSFLLSILAPDSDPIFDFCIRRIQDTNGMIQIKQLMQETGYSTRWLNIKFEERLGISPKNYASIVRFQRYYQSFLRNKEELFFRNDFYLYYYDQSHFIRDFKRFTGHSPKKLEHTQNNFGEIFYKG